MKTKTILLTAIVSFCAVPAYAGGPTDSIDPTVRASCGIRPVDRSNAKTQGYVGSTLNNWPYCKFMYEQRLKSMLENSCGSDSQGSYRYANCFSLLRDNQAYVLCTAVPVRACTVR